MTDAQQREAARQFFYKWNKKGQEDEDARSYWIDILQNILGMENVTDRVEFEKKVKGPDGNTKRIDVYIPETKVLIEQKSLGIALDKPQTGHDGMTPYQQAKMYEDWLPHSEKARWIVTSNFAEIWIYDMEKPAADPTKIALEDMPSKYQSFNFLIKKEVAKVNREIEISKQAGYIIGDIYDAFLKQYKNPDDPETLRSLNKLCVRIVFCLYAEDAAVFGRKNMFHDYMAQFDTRAARGGLQKLFRVLNQKPEDRDRYLADDDPKLAEFPYVNGGLFADDDIEIPPFTDEIMSLLLRNASEDFDWSGISPTIFGAVFESTLNPDTRRSGGMHYTSIENIHKVIDPLFLDDLKAELEEIKGISIWKDQEKRLKAYQDKLAATVLLDPAAGSGNFLTESYICVRRLENEVISLLQHGQVIMGVVENPIKVSIGQLYGIEINDFAVTVARTALWIAENQMMKETEDIVHMTLDFLPLKTAAHIVEGNALRIDWQDVVPKDKLSYIIGNPPFVGHQYRSDAQANDMKTVFSDLPKYGKLDYVCAWYKLAADVMKNTRIKAAFVSTNSICQGESVSILWDYLISKKDVVIQFAHQTFIWTSEAADRAAVHCVIIGFKCFQDDSVNLIFNTETCKTATHINGYLLDAPDVYIESRGKQLTDGFPEMSKGSQPTDGGFLLLSPDERKEMIEQYPAAEPLIKRFVGSRDLINNEERYCLWLKGVEPSKYRDIKPIMGRLEKVAEARSKSPTASVQKDASTPMLFTQIRQPTSMYLAVPEVSSQNRRYIPIGFLSPDIIASNKLYLVPNSTLYMFGVMESNVHMAWMRVFCGRLKSDYSYSPAIYNNFPWPEATEEQIRKIEESAQAILDARKMYPSSTFADLYDPLTMPHELRKAHQANDVAVMKAYGMPIKETDEAACVAWLMRLYQEKTAQEK